MRYSVGVMVAPRPVSTVTVSVAGLLTNTQEWVPTLFAEPSTLLPDVILNNKSIRIVHRPTSIAPGFPAAQLSETGQYGNFQNFVQTLRDLLVLDTMADAIMVVEDDAMFASNLLPFLAKRLWPAKDCGVVSLYCPDIKRYIVPAPGLHVIKSTNLVGGLVQIFPRKVAEILAWSAAVDTWPGDVKQRRPLPYQRIGMDTWVGRVLRDMKLKAFFFSPSLIAHYAPPETNGDNSSTGVNNPPNHTSGYRHEFNFIGQTIDPESIFPVTNRVATCDLK